MIPGAYNQYLMVLVCQEELSLFWIPSNNIHWGGGGVPFGWCGVITFTQSWRVISRIHPVLAGFTRQVLWQLQIQAQIELLAYSGVTSAWNPACPLFCSARWCLMAHRLCPVTWLVQAAHRKKSHHSQDSRLEVTVPKLRANLSHSEPAPTSAPSRMDDMWSGTKFSVGFQFSN